MPAPGARPPAATSLPLHGLVLAVALSGCASFRTMTTPGEGGPDWRELTSDHFVLSTDLSSEDARASIQVLERTRQALLVAAWGNRSGGPKPKVDVVILAHAAALADLAGGGGPVGWVHAGSGRLLMVLSGSAQDIAAQPIVRHELFHSLAAFLLVNQPSWVNEGLAEYMETLEVSLEEPQVVLGRASRGRVSQYVRSPLSVGRLLSQANQPLDWEDPKFIAGYYGTSWVLVHYLRSQHGDAFVGFQAAVGGGLSPEDAWKRFFGDLTVAGLDRDLLTYAKTGSFPVATFNVPLGPPWQAQERPLSEVEVLLLRERLRQNAPVLRSKELTLAALRDVDRAIQLDPLNGTALEEKGLLSGWPAVVPAIERRLAEHRHEWQTWWLVALAAHAGALPKEREEEGLQKASRLAGDNPDVLHALALHDLQIGNAAAALPLVTRAAELAPWNSAILLTAAKVEKQTGHCVEAALLARAAANAMLQHRPEKPGAAYQEAALLAQDKCG
jgi:hypothetical protein